MSLSLRSALRVWRKRPAGPVLLALGLLLATLLATSTELALDGAEAAARDDDRAALGEVMARLWTPGGYTVSSDELLALQTELAAARGTDAPARDLPLFLERRALLTQGSATSANWRVLGLPAASLDALGLPVPAPGTALVDPGGRQTHPAGQAEVRIQRAADEAVERVTSELGELARTVLVGTTYVHAPEDRYQFEVEVAPGASRLTLSVITADNGTDMDLEATDPTGATTLDDDGTPASPDETQLVFEMPEAGTWDVAVHAKFASGVAFRLEVVQIFDAQDAEALGRLLEGEGWRAVGADLGLTEQAVLSLTLREADLALLGPGADGLLVLALDRLQGPLGLDGKATGILVVAHSDEQVLRGLAPNERQALAAVLADRQRTPDDTLDPLRGLQLDPVADRAAAERAARLESTERLLLVVLPAGVAAGVLLSAWAAGLHARRLSEEVQVLAALGQSRGTSWRLVLFHLAPPFVAGTLFALALAPVVGLAVGRGIGLEGAVALTPGVRGLAVPLLALVPVALVTWLTLKDAVGGRDPRVSSIPAPARARALAAAAALGLAAVLAGVALLASDGPAAAFLLGALAAAAAVLALLWAPLLEPLLARPRTLAPGALGLYRTRSSHPYLALAGAAATLVLAALLSGVALSNAASPDAARESGGYEVLAESPVFTEDLSELLDEGERVRASALLQATLGIEYLMRVEGTGIHSIPTDGSQRVYGIDTSFAQRHRHLVTPTGALADPVSAVATRDDLALVTSALAEDLAGDTVEIEGPLGRLSYTVVGVLETRLVDGVYVSKDALPTHFTQLAGEQRVRLGDETEPGAYAAALQDVFKDEGLEATTSEKRVEERLQGQVRAGATLQALASLGVVLLLLLVVLLGLRAQAERRTSDAVLVALGTQRAPLAVGIATEMLLPLVAGFALAFAVALPLSARLDELEGLAFPLTPIDVGALVRAGLVALGLVLVLAVGVAGFFGRRAVSHLDQGVLRELD